MSPKRYKLELDNDLILEIMDNCFGNIFIVDPESRVLFANYNCVTAFGVPRERIIGYTTQNLVESGILSRSTSQECLETEETVIGTVQSKLGVEMLNVSRPVYNEKGELSFIMTYGQRSDTMNEFLDAIQEEKNRALGYKNALLRVGELDASSRDIVIVSPKMKKIFKQLDAVAPTDGTIMLYSESGVGKDVIANYIHKNSSRKDEPFIPINCAAIPRDLMESEFFGYEKGAFTGANSRGKAGLFEIADGGTLFLDEIGELPLEMQTKFLRVLESGTFTRIGGYKQIKTDVRLITATNRDLRQMIQEKTFREDLYFRLNVLSFMIPPLRERVEAIETFVNLFLQIYNKKYHKRLTISDTTLQQFKSYHWSGNIRELKNVIERMVLTSDTDFSQPDYAGIPLHVADTAPAMPASAQSASMQTASLPSAHAAQFQAARMGILSSGGQSIKDLFIEAERQKVLDVLLSVNGNKKKAAKILGISRGKLYKLLDQ